MAIETLDKLLAEFKETLDADVKSLSDLHEKDKAGAGRPGRWFEALRRAAIVLLAANVENYVENLICEGINHLCANKVRARKYPKGYRLWNLRQSVNNKDAEKIVDQLMKLWNEVRELDQSELQLGEIKKQFANPTPSDVNWIMSLLDYEKYTENVTLKLLKTDTSVRVGLSELAQRRNDIAHGDKNQKPEIDDVTRLTKFALLFANRIHKDVESKIQECLQKD